MTTKEDVAFGSVLNIKPELGDFIEAASFLKFQDSLEKIKVFAEEVTQLRGVGTFLYATSIGKKFNELMEEYEVRMKDLGFVMTVIFDEQ
ncbi:26124_t:CDS:2 [Dentiscutata erythropus]|uniref:26124_t:CDS:1 n=1 Tax=Dentiscutata erythropus TaxID=1348616 RepID=A0A9N9D585_9GLOM|nr:26124_t:CDS:2 [Dentiscutata erythropus]